MKIDADDLMQLGIIDGIIPEPSGGAHHDHAAAAALVGDQIETSLKELQSLSTESLLDQRYQKFRTIAQFFKTSSA